MKSGNLLIYSILLALMPVFTACVTEAELSSVSKVIVSVQMPPQIKNSISFKNKTVTLRSQRLTYTAQSNDRGVAYFENIVPDIYNVYASWDLTPDEYVSMADSLVESKEALISGVLSQVKIFSEDSVRLETLLSEKQSLLISKIYAWGTKDNNNSRYEADSYIEIFNNSDEVQYLDSIYLALLEGDSPMAFPAALFPTTLHARQIFQFPGNGKQYPIQPGKSVTICNSARNHTIGAATSVNLQQSEFEFKGNKYPNNDAAVAMRQIFTSYLAIKEINLQPAGNNCVCLFKTDSIVQNFPLDYAPGKTSGTQFMRFSAKVVFDGVEAIKYRTDGLQKNYKRFQKFIDAGFVNISNGTGLNHESVERKVDTQRSAAAGRIYLKDTNNSQDDFVNVTDPTPKKYDKPLLLQ